MRVELLKLSKMIHQDLAFSNTLSLVYFNFLEIIFNLRARLPSSGILSPFTAEKMLLCHNKRQCSLLW